MSKRTTLAVLAGLLAATLLPAGCRDSVSPERRGPTAPQFGAPAAGGIALDQQNGTLGAVNSAVTRKGFTPTTPRLGSAIIATVYWLGSPNMIPTVSDHPNHGTPVGNGYKLVTYVTAHHIAIGPFVATQLQNFPAGAVP